MNQREHEVRVRVSGAELAFLDEQRGTVPRAAFIRTLIHEPPDRGQIATAEEVLVLLSEQARAGKVAAMIALERALRNAPSEGIDDNFDEELARICSED